MFPPKKKGRQNMQKPEILYDIIERLYGLSEEELYRLSVYVFARSKTLSRQGFESACLSEYMDKYATYEEREFIREFAFHYIDLGRAERAKADGRVSE